MTPTYDDSPEVAGGHDLPEAYISQPSQQVWSPQPSIAPTYASQTPVGYGHNGQYTEAVKSGSSAGVPGGVVADEAAYTTPESTIPEKGAAAAAGGISLVVILSIIIAILSAAVIGLAAGTGVATSNYNKANSKAIALSSSLAAAQATNPPSKTSGSNGTPTSSSSSSTGSPTTDFNSITNGCTDNAEDVNGLIYTSASFGNANFTMYCNKDTINNPLFSLFAINFNGCMDACAGWNTYNKTTKGTCLAVSFIPSWSVAATALSGGAPGDCYLKPGPIVKANLTAPNIGNNGEVDAAILIQK